QDDTFDFYTTFIPTNIFNWSGSVGVYGPMTVGGALVSSNSITAQGGIVTPSLNAYGTTPINVIAALALTNLVFNSGLNNLIVTNVSSIGGAGYGNYFLFIPNNCQLSAVNGSAGASISPTLIHGGGTASMTFDAPGVANVNLNFDSSGNLGLGSPGSQAGSHNLVVAGSVSATNGFASL